jgi:hypothetical protein
MSRSHMPPVPPANRSPKGPGGAEGAQSDKVDNRHVPENVDKQARQGAVKQNTTNQGYQQDR